MRKAPVATALRRAAVALTLIAIVGCGTSTTTSEGSPGPSPGSASDTPTPNSSLGSPTVLEPSDTRLVLEVTGALLFSDPLAAPPIVEVTPSAMIFDDISSENRDFSRTAELEYVLIDATLFSRIIEEARAAGLAESDIRLWDEDDSSLSPIAHTLTLFEDGQLTGRLMLQGAVTPNESGPDAAARTSAWSFIKRLLKPLEGYDLSGAQPYIPDRFMVYSLALPSDLTDAMSPGLPVWPLESPTSWPNGCRFFSGSDAETVRMAVTGEMIGSPWSDVDGALWILVARPLTPSEPEPCR